MLRLSDERVLAGEGGCELYLGGKLLAENAVTVGRRLSVVARLPRQLGTYAFCLCLFREDAELMRIPMRYRGMQGGQDVYACELTLSEVGIFFYSFLGEGTGGGYFGLRGRSGRSLAFSRTGGGARLQLLTCDSAYPYPRWLLGGIIYHIFVDRFRRGGNPPVREDAVLNPDWEGGVPALPERRGGHLENNEFFGGTLDGITEKLDDIAALGVNALYLSPIFEAYSNHKYDVGDYLHIDDMFGGERAFLRLVSAARKRGIRIILDAVFNHTGSDSLYFNQKGRYPTLGAYQSVESPYFSWYRFGKHPDEYESWWGFRTLPRLDPAEPSLHEFLVGEGGVVSHYAKAGIGGLRLDVADELEDGFIRDIKAALAREAPDAVLYGEVWEDASHKVAYGVRKHYYLGNELDGVMNYPLREGLLVYFRTGNTRPLRTALLEVLPNMPRRAAALAMNILGTHDTVRALTALVGEEEGDATPRELAARTLSPEARLRGIRLLILAYLALCTLPGIPTVFYGDEVGLEGYSDPLNRRPYPWHRRDSRLLSAYREIGRMRRDESILCEGQLRVVLLLPELFVFSRHKGTRVLLTVINRGERGVRVRFAGRARGVYGCYGNGQSFLVPPLGGAVFRAAKGNHLRLFFDDGTPILFET